MNTILRSYSKALMTLVILASVTSSAFSQQIRTAYFMHNSTERISLNPAFRPERGYASIPVLGALGANYSTNGVAIDNFLYPKDGKLVTFMDNSVGAESFLGGLKDQNQINADFGTQILSAGWYAGKGFWTASLSMKGLANVRAPKTMFEFMKLGNGPEGKTYDITDLKAYTEAYLEMAAGYSRPITDKLTVGGKFKVLLGAGSMDASIDHLHAEMGVTDWKITSTGSMSASLKGLTAEDKVDDKGNQYMSDFDFDSPGISGFGLGVDLGATYKLTDNITLSAAVLDLGFISWGKSGNLSGDVNGDFNFSGFNLAIGESGNSEGPGMADQFDEKKDEFSELFHFGRTASESRTTRLRSTINLGGEYRILENQLGFGLLSSTRLYTPKAYTELTVSANYRPVSWFEATLSYSFIHSDFKTYGIALNFTPSWINFFIGSDYMFTKVTPQFLPISGSAASMYMGISIPLQLHRN